MVNLVNLKDFANSIEESQKINPTIERWLDGAKELRRELSERVVSLCRYFDQIPKEAISSYANALLDALTDEDLEGEIRVSKQLNQRILDFARLLEDSGVSDKAGLVRKAVTKRLNSAK